MTELIQVNYYTGICLKKAILASYPKTGFQWKENTYILYM